MEAFEDYQSPSKINALLAVWNHLRSEKKIVALPQKETGEPESYEWKNI